MELSRDDHCARCAAMTPAGCRAFWDASAQLVLCLRCHDAETAPSVQPALLPPPRPIDPGVAGASARSEAARRSETPGAGGRASSWEKGADGEERLAARLDRRLSETVRLHDRKVPGTEGNIDHLVVARSGVWVVDAKNYSGRVERRDKGTFRRLDDRLYVAGRDRTEIVRKMSWQVDAVRLLVEPMGLKPEHVRPALVFTNSDWALFARPFCIDGVLIGWARAVEKRILKASPELSAEMVTAAATELSARLPASESKIDG